LDCLFAFAKQKNYQKIRRKEEEAKCPLFRKKRNVPTFFRRKTLIKIVEKSPQLVELWEISYNKPMSHLGLCEL
jgi:hypothetical protein